MRRIALLVVAFTVLAGAVPQTPRAVVQQFYRTYLRERPPGLPDGKHLEAIAPYLSRRLRQQIDAALRRRDAFIRENPDEKPPFVDGDHFSSLFEGPRVFEIVRSRRVADGRWHVRVRFRYDAVAPPWEDTVVVTREDGRYVIDDVVYSGAGAFNPAGRLSDVLRTK